MIKPTLVSINQPLPWFLVAWTHQIYQQREREHGYQAVNVRTKGFIPGGRLCPLLPTDRTGSRCLTSYSAVGWSRWRSTSCWQDQMPGSFRGKDDTAWRASAATCRQTGKHRQPTAKIHLSVLWEHNYGWTEWLVGYFCQKHRLSRKRCLP